MKLGVCTSPDKIMIAAEAGFEFIECGFAWLSSRSEEEYQEIVKIVDAAPIKVEACNGMLPAELKVTGPNVDKAALEAYLEKTFARAARLGVKAVVFGSGGARAVPEGASHVEGWRQVVEYLRLAGPIARKYGVCIAIEPLRAAECNIVNYVSEGTLLSAIVDDPAVGVLGDTHHMNCGCEPVEHLVYAGEKLYHIHISHSMGNEGGRDYPYENDGNDHAAVFEALKKANYQGRVSIEAGCKDMLEDGKRAFALLNALRG